MSGQYITLSFWGLLKEVLRAVRPFLGNGFCGNLSSSCSGFDVDNTVINAETIDELTRTADIVSKVNESTMKVMSGAVCKEYVKEVKARKDLQRGTTNQKFCS